MTSIIINPSPPRVPAALLDAFRKVPTTHISDCLARLPGICGLRPFHNGEKLVGTALTVKTRPGDNLLIHKSFDLARPGDVIVVDGGGDTSQALVGELMMAWAVRLGVVGFVVDGAIRDSATFATSSFACYARAAIHKGPYKDGPGHINVPVTVGGQIVNPGDIVVGDQDGLIAFALQVAEDLLAACWRQREAEERILRQIEEGHLDRSWIAGKLANW